MWRSYNSWVVGVLADDIVRSTLTWYLYSMRRYVTGLARGRHTYGLVMITAFGRYQVGHRAFGRRSLSPLSLASTGGVTNGLDSVCLSGNDVL